MFSMVNSPLFEKKIVVFIIGIIIGFIILSLINNNFPSFFKCNDTEKFTQDSSSFPINDNSVPSHNNEQQFVPQMNTNIVPGSAPLQNDQEQHNNIPSGYDSENVFASVPTTQNNVQNIPVPVNNLPPVVNNVPLPCTQEKDYAEFQPITNVTPSPVKQVMVPVNMPATVHTDSDEHDSPTEPTMASVTNPIMVPTKPVNVPTTNTVSGKSIKFYNFNTTWCGWSKKFQPEWDKFTAMVKSNPKLNSIIDVQDVKCDNDANKQLCIDNDVQGYPTVIINVNGKSTDYDGPRTVDGLMAVANKIGGGGN